MQRQQVQQLQQALLQQQEAQQVQQHLTIVDQELLQVQHSMVAQQELFLITQSEHLVQLVQTHQVHGELTSQVQQDVQDATTAGTVTTAAQPNITMSGTLSSLTVTGTMNLEQCSLLQLLQGQSATAGTITGDYTLTSGSTLNATYADLAEKYTADQDYEPGTVVVFGGDAELSTTGQICVMQLQVL